MKRFIGFISIGLAACGTTPTTPPVPTEVDVVGPATGTSTQYVVSKLRAPAQRTDFAIDLNGDGRADNQLGNIIGALAAQMLDTQMGIDEAVAKGDVVLLVNLQAADLKSAPDKVGVTVNLGVTAKTPPKFDGSDMFTIDSKQGPANFFGRIVAGKLKTNNPVTTKTPVTVSIILPLAGGNLDLRMNGAQVSFTIGDNGLTSGQLNGSIKNEDIQGKIIPAVAKLLSDQLVKYCTPAMGMPKCPDTCMGSGKQIQSLFDTGACEAAKMNDCKVEACEVANNQIIKNVLAPDVQIYDAAGNYAPNKDNAKRDSLSLGLAFDAVKAKF